MGITSRVTCIIRFRRMPNKLLWCYSFLGWNDSCLCLGTTWTRSMLFESWMASTLRVDDWKSSGKRRLQYILLMDRERGVTFVAIMDVFFKEFTIVCNLFQCQGSRWSIQKEGKLGIIICSVICVDDQPSSFE